MEYSHERLVRHRHCLRNLCLRHVVQRRAGLVLARLDLGIALTASSPGVKKDAPFSAAGQLQLDAPVTLIGFLRVAGVDRLEFAIARRHKSIGRNAPQDQIFDDGCRSRRR